MVRVNSLWRQVLQEGQSGKVSTLDLKGAVDQNLSAMAFRGPVNFYGNLFTTNPTLREVNAVRAKGSWWTDKEINFSCTLFLATEKLVKLYIWNKPPRENIMPVQRGPVLVPHGPRCYHDDAPYEYIPTYHQGNTFGWTIQNPPNPGEDGWWYVVGQPADAPFLAWSTPCLNAKPSTVPQAIYAPNTMTVANVGGDHFYGDLPRSKQWELQNAELDYYDDVYLNRPFAGLIGEGLTGFNPGKYPISFRAFVWSVLVPEIEYASGQVVQLNPGEAGASVSGLVPWDQDAGYLDPSPAVEVWFPSGVGYQELNFIQPSAFKALATP